MQPLEGLGNDKLGGERPLIAKVKYFIENYFSKENYLI